jgi:sugar lactone lactonase YvrE
MGNVYITAMDSGQLVRVTPEGTSTVLASGLNQPLGVTCDGWGNVYVGGGASGGGWVGVVDSDGDFTQLISNTAGAIAVHALAISPDGSLLIADNVAGRIMRYDPLLRDMLEANWITGLSRPKNMAWDLEGNMYVVQRGINTVSKFNTDGSALPFTLRGVALDGPFGIAFDGLGALFVSSANAPANRIDRIDLDGDSGVVTTFATGMANPGGLTFQGSVTPVPLA